MSNLRVPTAADEIIRVSRRKKDTEGNKLKLRTREDLRREVSRQEALVVRLFFYAKGLEFPNSVKSE